MTNAFLPALRRSAYPRVVNISSGTGSLAATAARTPEIVAAAKSHEVVAGGTMPPGTFAAYRSSKAALNELTVVYAQALAADGIKLNAMAPGLRRPGLNPPPRLAVAIRPRPAGAVRLALLPDDAPTGEFVSWDGTPVPW